MIFPEDGLTQGERDWLQFGCKGAKTAFDQSVAFNVNVWQKIKITYIINNSLKQLLMCSCMCVYIHESMHVSDKTLYVQLFKYLSNTMNIHLPNWSKPDGMKCMLNIIKCNSTQVWWSLVSRRWSKTRKGTTNEFICRKTDPCCLTTSTKSTSQTVSHFHISSLIHIGIQIRWSKMNEQQHAMCSHANTI